MTQHTDRELLKEIHRAWVMASDTGGVIHHLSGPMSRVAAALAQPEPEGPTDEELGAFFVEKGLLYATESTYALASVTRNVHGQVLARAFREALTRFARPTIEPVPVAERPWEREGWCDAHGRCWFGTPKKYPADAGWILREPEELLARHAVSLPHHALPAPGAEVSQ